MTDDEITYLLRSTNSLVVIEAPAGSGKTHQAASYAADVVASLNSGKLLVLTHTHAACSVIAERTKAYRNKIDIRTLDSMISIIASAYRLSLNLPEDVSAWARQNGYESLATKVAHLLRSNPMIAKHLAKLFPIIICDEHQDANEAQGEIVKMLGNQGALLRVFGDPMQIIPGGRRQNDEVALGLARWNALKDNAVFGELEIPHRWKDSNPALGEWIFRVREGFKNGQSLDLTTSLPKGVSVQFAENGSIVHSRYQLIPENWNELNALLNVDKQLLLMAVTNMTVQSLRGTFRRRFPIWEGHTRNNLEKFIESLDSASVNFENKSLAYVVCLKSLLVGFSDSKYGDRLIREINDPSDNPRGQIPPQLKIMAEFIRADQSHVGFAKATEYLRGLITKKSEGFSDLHIDYQREFDDLIKLKDYDDPMKGFANIAQRRSRSYPKPPRKTLSTVHKAKGLEAESVVIFACDNDHFPNTLMKRNLLYVALSRATESLTIVVSRNNRSLLVEI